MSSQRLGRSAAAIMIGIGGYPRDRKISSLPFAARDAEAMAKLFADPAICNFDTDSIQLVVDQEATRERIINLLSNWLPEHGRGTELAVVFLAGHGVVQRHGASEEGYFLSYDASLDNVAANGISMRDIARWIDGVDASAVIVFLDCCHSGKAVFLRDGSTMHGEGISQSIANQMGIGPSTFSGLSGRRRFVIASCDEGQSSIEAQDFQHGLFTYHLLQGIAGAADTNRDGSVDIAELFSYVSEMVTKDALERFGLEQRPWTHATWAGKVFVSQLGSPMSSVPETSRFMNSNYFREVERNVVGAVEEELLGILNTLCGNPLTEGVPLVFHCLAHESESVRLTAKAALQAIRWSTASEYIRTIAGAPDERMDYVLEGLAALEARRDIVALLDELVNVLKGGHWQRAVFLLERKRLGLTLGDVAEAFRERESPYELHEVLGAGLFTAAYLASRRATPLKFVVRVLRPEFVSNAKIRQAFLETSQRAFESHHQSLVLTRDFGGYPDKALYYVVRDHVDGPTLREVLEKGRRFELMEVVRILQRIVSGLRPFHAGPAGQLHGGVKPSNIFLSRDGKVILGDPSMTLPPPNAEFDRLAYDLRYAAPEAFRTYLSGLTGDLSQIGLRADFYSLGCVAYELFCGVAPFIAENQYDLYAKHDRESFEAPERFNSRLKGEATTFLKTLLAKVADNRYSSIDAIEDVLLRLRDHFGGGSGAPGTGLDPDEPTPPWRPPDGKERSANPSTIRVHELADGSLAHFAPDKTMLSWATATINGPASSPTFPHWYSEARSLPPRYEAVRLIAQGGMGAVYLALDAPLRRQVAIKLLTSTIHSTEGLTRFTQEATLLSALSHPNIVQIYDAGVWESQAYMVMEYVDGGSLSELLKKRTLSSEEVLPLMMTIADAMAFAHSRGIIHRDIKPSNILLSSQGSPKICDFGLAKQFFTEGEQTITGAIMGTPAYMSPEQASGRAKSLGPATDIYSLGVVLYRAITGVHPFDPDGGRPHVELLFRIMHDEPRPPRQINRHVSRDLEAVCLKCMEKSPEHRYQSASELAQDLRRIVHGEGISARPASRLTRIHRWTRRNPLAATLLFATAVATCTALAAIAALLSRQ